MSLKSLKKYILESSDSGFLISDFYTFGTKEELIPCLKVLEEEELLEEIGDGIYAKKKESEYFERKIYADGFQTIIRQVLSKLGITEYVSKAVLDYNSGKSTQVPTGRCFTVDRIPPEIKMTFGGIKTPLYFITKEYDYDE